LEVREEVRRYAKCVGTGRVGVMVVERRGFDEDVREAILDYAKGAQGGMGREKTNRG